MKLSDLAKVASDEYLFGKNAHLRGSSNCEAHWGDIALAVAKAVLAEAAQAMENLRYRDGKCDHFFSAEDAPKYGAALIRAIATELERESDAR